jgi:FAD:protein FMN transferase
MSQYTIREPKISRQELKLMGNLFGFSAICNHEKKASQAITAAITEVQRIETLLTTFATTSQTNQINESAGIKPVVVHQEVFDLIERSLRISALTQGAFDITYGSIDKRLWNFDTTMTSLPDPQTARQAVKLINYKNVILDRKANSVFLKEKGMRIGFGGIGKGYAADRARSVMRQHGIESGIVNAAGDLTVWGTQPGGEAWTIGLADPDKRQLPFASVKLTDASVATSGNYEKYAIIDGKRYSHTIDPKTGYPVHGIKSVTIICKNAELADAMATPVMVMGIKAGLHLVNQIKNIACIIIDERDVIHTSNNISLNTVL